MQGISCKEAPLEHRVSKHACVNARCDGPSSNAHPHFDMHVPPAAGLNLILEKQLQGVDAMRLREVPLVWFGMAEVWSRARLQNQH